MAMGFWEEEDGSQMPLSSHQIKYTNVNMTPDANLDPLEEEGLSEFSVVKLFLPDFSIMHFLERKEKSYAPHPRNRVSTLF